MAKISIHEWFTRKKKAKAETEAVSARLDIPGNLWIKCYKCNAALFTKDLEANLKVCPKCNYHFKLSSAERIKLLIDEGTFKELNAEIRSTDFLGFTDSQPYQKRIEDSMLKSNLMEAVITGEGQVSSIPVALGVMDFSFMGGSMGSVVGEKITRIAEHGMEHKLPVIVVTASGGARMQEGIMSLMQMAKTSAALQRLREFGLPYIVILTDPTTGGTTASFAMLGDIHLAEPGALIGFAGPRVIEQTIRQKLPVGFQRSEFLESHGMVDAIVNRQDLKSTLTKILRFYKD
ncbi:MAG: acetyl-CoA carboxylase, carboxyltransferase subunit beta [Candidatus Margulisiibacteriota bacterium]